ncbi:MAG: hypothetical protein ACL93V_12875 [Candidatus Electrothrix sp. YB6]
MKIKIIATGIMVALLTAAAAGAQSMPIVAQGNISVYKNGKLATKFTGRNPVEEEALLICDGQCMLKSTGISLIGTDGAELSVKTDQEQFNLLLRQGKVDFVINDTVGKMGFYTPDGQYTVANLIFNAGTHSPVRGYMQVEENGSTQVGVYEGRMIFNTVDGPATVDGNNHIVLAQAMDPSAAEPMESSTERAAEADNGCKLLSIENAPFHTAVAVVGASAAIGVAEFAGADLLGDDDDDDASASR